MKVDIKPIPNILLLTCFIYIYQGCKGQKPFGENLLIAQTTIPMPAVKGRIDHLDVNLKEKVVYVAALGNNSLEIVDISNGKVLHSIKDLDEPQGVAYIPQQQEIFVANGGNGDCYFYNAHSFEKTATIHLSSDADDVRYDSTSEKIYVGYGAGGIAVIDAKQHKQIGSIKLSAHPEGFQLDKKLNRLFINVPDAHQVVVADLTSSKLITIWSSGEFQSNFPLAIDTFLHHIFIGYRHPPKLVVMNEETGTIVSTSDLVSDVDDVYFDVSTGKIFASGGGGFISIYQWEKSILKQVANIPVRNGARTSLLIPSLNLFVLAELANQNAEAQLRVYKTR